MVYTYNEQTGCFGIYTNFEPEKLPEGYKKISEKKYKELTKVKEQEQEQSEQQSEE